MRQVCGIAVKTVHTSCFIYELNDPDLSSLYDTL